MVPDRAIKFELNKGPYEEIGFSSEKMNFFSYFTSKDFLK